jgi:hypothetical protein
VRRTGCVVTASEQVSCGSAVMMECCCSTDYHATQTNGWESQSTIRPAVAVGGRAAI